jgi:CheY-like chemotaxis protein
MFHQKPFPYVPDNLTTLLVKLVRKRRDSTLLDASEGSDDRLAVPCCVLGEEQSGSGGPVRSSNATLPKIRSVSSLESENQLPQHLSVLFCDDDRTLRRLAMRALKNILPDCRMREASSGENALQLCESEQFDLIFMDQHMISSIDSALTGSQTIKELRRVGCKSLIIGLSANQQQETFLAAGANHFWLKPFPCEASSLRQALVGILSDDKKVATM